MGTLSISIPIKVSGNYRVKDSKFARQLVEQNERNGERVSPFDEVLGIWKDRSETTEMLTIRLRDRNDRRNG